MTKHAKNISENDKERYAILQRAQSLIDEVRTDLRRMVEEGKLKDFAERHQFEYSWLARYARGEIKNPGALQTFELALMLNKASLSIADPAKLPLSNTSQTESEPT